MLSPCGLSAAGLWGRGRLTAAPGNRKVPQHLPRHPPVPGDPSMSLDGPFLDGPFLDGPPLVDPVLEPC